MKIKNEVIADFGLKLIPLILSRKSQDGGIHPSDFKHTCHLGARSLSLRVTQKTPLASFHEVLAPVVVTIRINPFTTANGGYALLTTQPDLSPENCSMTSPRLKVILAQLPIQP